MYELPVRSHCPLVTQGPPLHCPSSSPVPLYLLPVPGLSSHSGKIFCPQAQLRPSVRPSSVFPGALDSFSLSVFGRTTRHVGSEFPDQGSNLRPLHGNHGVLTTDGWEVPALGSFIIINPLS